MADWPYLEGSWFKIPVLVGRCGQLPVVLGSAPARDLFAVSFADLFEESAQTGYQRPCDLRHAREFREYIEGPGATTIPLTFNLRGRAGPAWRLEPEGAKQREVRRFLWRDPYVDNAKLSNRVAPCVVHTLDAFFNALVLEELHREGETNVVAIHDSWGAPAFHLYVDRPGACTGASLIASCIEHAGSSWLEGIGSVYGWFVDATLGTPYRRFARGLRRAWCKRVAERRWPKFTAS